MLLNFNNLSSVRMQQMSERFLHHTKTLVEMKKDLDGIFRRIRWAAVLRVWVGCEGWKGEHGMVLEVKTARGKRAARRHGEELLELWDPSAPLQPGWSVLPWEGAGT